MVPIFAMPLDGLQAPTCIHLQGIFVDENGMVAEGPNMNLGIITHENELVVRRLHGSLMTFMLFNLSLPAMAVVSPSFC